MKVNEETFRGHLGQVQHCVKSVTALLGHGRNRKWFSRRAPGGRGRRLLGPLETAQPFEEGLEVEGFSQATSAGSRLHSVRWAMPTWSKRARKARRRFIERKGIGCLRGTLAVVKCRDETRSVGTGRSASKNHSYRRRAFVQGRSWGRVGSLSGASGRASRELCTATHEAEGQSVMPGLIPGAFSAWVEEREMDVH